MEIDQIQAFASLCSVLMSVFALFYSRKAIFIGKRAASSEMKADALNLYEEGLQWLSRAKSVLEEQIEKNPKDRSYNEINMASSILWHFENKEMDKLRRIARNTHVEFSLGINQENASNFPKYPPSSREGIYETVDEILRNDIERLEIISRKMEAAKAKTIGEFLAELLK